jgi:hypothetical protein
VGGGPNSDEGTNTMVRYSRYICTLQCWGSVTFCADPAPKPDPTSDPTPFFSGF